MRLSCLLRCWINRCLVVALLLVAACARATEVPAEARVLYLNSYHRGYSWSDGIEEGLRQRLMASGKSIELSVEYLDSRRFALHPQTESIARALEIKYADYRPQLLLVSDNDAIDFALKYRERLFAGVPIVFCGYNSFRPELLRGQRNITGVNEEISIEDTVAMALSVHPKARTLAFITSTADASSRRISEFAEARVFPRLKQGHEVVVLKDASLDEIRQRLAALPRNALLFLSGQARDRVNGRELTPAENGKLISALSPVPAYTFWDFHLGTGVVGGHILTGPDQGLAAADLALRVLGGEPADRIPVVMTSPTNDVFDYPAMQRFGIDPEALPAGARIINKPFSAWERYRDEILLVLALLLVQSLLIGGLVRSMLGRRRALQALAEERALLEQHVHERTVALEAANAQLATLSFTDGLTRLPNRRRFDETLEAEFARHRRSGTQLSLIMLDIDHFKAFNDTYGHVAGDECLRAVGGAIAKLVNRSSDLAARFGGEEFAVILPETEAPGAAQLAERLRAGIEALQIPHANSLVAPVVTVSLGVVTVLPAKLSNPLEALSLADALLYQAKSGGRNRVVAHALE
ncbi:MAG: diguanylate cyclase [Burkholderiaceae bacterium]|nr:diguanylate cyclase [Burkholderiaceae bacterium]